MHDVQARLTELTMDGPFTRADAGQFGISRWVLDRLVGRGDVERVGRGLYTRRSAPSRGESSWQRVQREHLALARQSLRAHPAHVLSHQSAALAYGWPVDQSALTAVHLTAVGVVPQSRRARRVVLHHSGTVTNEVDRRAGLLVMSPARTVADCLRTLPAPEAVAVADGAIRSGETTLAETRAVLLEQRHWRGLPGAVRALTLIDPRRESWLESYSFVTLHEFGIELPTPQVEVFDPSGRLIGRVDGAWVSAGVVAEADGQAKYLMDDAGVIVADPTAAAKRVVSERHREGALEETGLVVVRWSTPEIRRKGEEVAERVIRARAGGDISRFRGRLRIDGEWVDLAR